MFKCLFLPKVMATLGLSLGCIGLGSQAVQAFTPFELTQTFNNPTPQSGDQFGISVSIDSTNALIGTRFDDTGAEDAGSAYLFDTETGNLLQTFNNPTPQSGDQFGYSVSIDSTNALIGAINDDTGAVNAGAVYLFDTETGNLLQTFNNPIPQDNATFGWSVSLSDTNTLIGDFSNNIAYLFDTETGNLLQTFNNPDLQVNDRFGYSVSVSGMNALIGDDGDDTGTVNAGSAYLFDIETGNLLQTFNNPTPQSGDRFGISVSIDSTNALIGAAQDNTGATEAGSAYLFDTETGNLLQTFNNPDPQEEDGFGISVSIDGTNALIGAGGDFNGTENRGSAYLFDTETGNLLQSFNNPTPEFGDRFGYSVSISETNILIGDFRDNTGAMDAGSAYLYQSNSTSVPEPSSVLSLFLITGIGLFLTKHQH